MENSQIINLSFRQKNILRYIIDNYIKNAKAVNSQQIAKLIKCSSATVRNECIMLEKNGFLDKVHKSSGGRIPTTKGYRYYVNNLMSQQRGLEAIKAKIDYIFEQRNISIKSVLEQCGKVLSELTKVTTIVSGPNIKSEKLVRMELIVLSHNEAIIIFVLSNGHIENYKMTSPQVTIKDLKIAVKLFNERLQGTYISELKEMYDLIAKLLQQQIDNSEQVLKEFFIALANISNISTNKYGIQYMLQNPEFNNYQKIKNVINYIESMSPLEYYQKSSHQPTLENQIDISIGEELNNKNIQDIAMLSTIYNVNNAQEAALTLIGPKRIEYEKIYSILAWINHKINMKYQQIKKLELKS